MGEIRYVKYIGEVTLCGFLYSLNFFKFGNASMHLHPYKRKVDLIKKQFQKGDSEHRN